MLLGRDPRAGIFLDSADISANHASITFVGGYYLLKDVGSTNGTFVNGVPTAEKVLADHDKIQIGPYEFLLELEKSDETVEIRMPIDRPANLTQGGLTYHRAVALKEIKGKKMMPHVNIMMTSRDTPVQARVSTANNQNVPALTEARVARARVKAVVSPSKKKPLLLIFVSVGATLLIVGGLAWLLDKKHFETVLLNEQSQAIEELRESTTLSQQREKQLELEVARKNEALQAVKDEAKKASEQLTGLHSRLAALESQPKVAPPALPPAPPQPAVPVPSVSAQAQPLAPEPPALGETPLLEYPPQVYLVQEVAIPLVIANKVAGSLKIPAGRTLKVKGVEDSAVLVDFNGSTARIPKDKTDFQQALNKLNATIKGNNAKIAKAREEAEAQTQLEALKLESKKSEMPLSFQITEIIESGVIGTTSTGVRVFLTGKEHTDHVPNEQWKGRVYPMGIVKKRPSSPSMRRYTTNLEDVVAFKSKGDSENTLVILEN